MSNHVVTVGADPSAPCGLSTSIVLDRPGGSVMLKMQAMGADALGQLAEALRRAARPDLRPLAATVARLIDEGNREGLLAGLDADGNPMAPLAQATIRGRGGSGPPGVPRFAASGLINTFSVLVEASADGRGGRIVATWRGATWAQYFRTGTRNMPARNPVGIRPSTRAKVQAAVDEFAAAKARNFNLGG